jgi:hypothetical protein
VRLGNAHEQVQAVQHVGKAFRREIMKWTTTLSCRGAAAQPIARHVRADMKMMISRPASAATRAS